MNRIIVQSWLLTSSSFFFPALNIKLLKLSKLLKLNIIKDGDMLIIYGLANVRKWLNNKIINAQDMVLGESKVIIL